MEIDNSISKKEDKNSKILEKIRPYLEHIDLNNVIKFRDGISSQIGYRLGFTADGYKTIVMSSYGTVYVVYNADVSEFWSSPIIKVLSFLRSNNLDEILSNEGIDFVKQEE